MDGIEVTTAIRNMTNTTGDSYYATVPILALTANAVTGMREMFMDNGMQDYISSLSRKRRLFCRTNRATFSM